MSLGDQLGIVGTILTLIGFGMTYIQFKDTKTKIKNTAQEIENFKKTLIIRTTISDISYLVSQIEELASISASARWAEYPDRSRIVCTGLSHLLMHPDIGDNKQEINDMLKALQGVETSISIANQKKVLPRKVTDMHKTVIQARDRMNTLLAEFNYKVVEE